MKTAIVFYSMNGNVRMVAEKVAAGTGADLIELIPKKAYPDKGMKKFMWGGAAVTFKAKPDLEPYAFNKDEYDMVILGSPVWAGTATICQARRSPLSRRVQEATPINASII